MAISKKLSELMGGEIWVESEEGVGSTFQFTVQVGKQSGEVSKRRSATTELAAIRVLVVDDNATSREILSSMLASFGLRVDQAGTGETALAQLEQANDYEPYKLVLMDWKMPGMDGIETSAGLVRTQGNSKLYLKLLRKVRESQADFINELREAVAKKDWELSTRLAHTLKGVAGNIGAEQLQDACTVLEMKATKQQPVDTECEAVEVELRRVLKSLSTFDNLLNEDVGITATFFDRDAVSQVLKILEEQLANYDAIAMETLETNLELLIASPLNSQLQRMEKH